MLKERLNGSQKENPQTFDIQRFTDYLILVEMRGIEPLTS